MKQKIALLLTVIMTATSMPLGITAADTAPEAQVPVQAEETVPEEASPAPGQAAEAVPETAEETKTEEAAAPAEETQNTENETPAPAPEEGTAEKPAEEAPAAEAPAAETPAEEAPAAENAQAEAEPAQEEAPKSAGWYLESDGWHNYYNATENGQSVVKERESEWFVPARKTTVRDGDSSMVLEAKATYYFDENGALAVGREVDTVAYRNEMDAATRFFDYKGIPVTGYARYGAKTHYIEKKKGMIKDAMVSLSKDSTYTLYKKSGKTSKKKLPAGKRYFDADGVMATGITQTKTNGIQFFDSKGLNQTGLISVDGILHFYGSSSGMAVDRFVKLSRNFTVTDLTTGKKITVAKGKHYFDSKGLMLTGEYQTKDNGIQYSDPAGLNHTGYVSVNGVLYYFDPNTGKVTNTSLTLDKAATITDTVTGKSVSVPAGTRFFTEDGTVQRGWYPSEEDKQFYYGSSGLSMTGHISVDGVIYFVYSKTGLLKNASTTLSKDATITDQVTGKSVKLLKGERLFGEDGVMVTGWYPSEAEKKFYYSDNGLTQTGYVSVGGELYYIDPADGLLKDGGNTLAKDLTITDQVTGRNTTLKAGTRYFDAEGSLVHGEYATKDNGIQYFDTYGNALYGYVYYDGNLHYIDRETGKLKNAVNNEIDGLKDIVNQDSPTAYVRLTPGARYFDENGNAVRGEYRTIDAKDPAKNKRYYGTMYFFNDGAMGFRFTRIGSDWKYFLREGGMVTGGDFDFSYEGKALSKPTSKGAYSLDGGTYFKKGHYFFDENGVMKTGLHEVKSTDGSVKNYFYNDTTGRRVEKGWALAGGKYYFLSDDGSVAIDSNGQMLTGAVTKEGFLVDPRNGKTYMIADDGSLAHGWQKVGDMWYHFNEKTGIMDGQSKNPINSFCTVDDKVFYFDKNGKMVTGLQKISGHWYYFDKKGVRQDNTMVYGISFDKNGIATKAGFGGPHGKGGAANVTDAMIEMVKMAQTRNISTNPTRWYAFTDKDHCQAGFFHYESGAWVLQLYCPVSVGAWYQGRSKTPTGRYVINDKLYRMTHFTSFYYVSWTSAGVGYHTPLYSISLHSVSASTKPVDPVIGGSGGHRSNGCMRLHYANAVWQYNKLPKGTWVWMYGK
jgi:glucan-binding YG repeat protein/lipoprotein-anchoring transpeptidase ErfK/SrfK